MGMASYFKEKPAKHPRAPTHLNRFSLFFLLLGLGIEFFLPKSPRAQEPIVKVGLYENPPKVFTSESGKPSGIFVDLIEHIAAVEGWTLQYVPGTWAQGLDRLQSGEIDLMPDVAFNADREKIFAFHKTPVLFSWSQVYASKNSAIKSILDLDGKRIAVLERSVQEETLTRLTQGFGLHIHFQSMPDYKTMFEMIASHQVDAGITNRFYGLMHARKFGLEDTAVVFEPSDLFFAGSNPKSIPLLTAIDRHLLDLKKDPQSIYYQSIKKWTSEQVKFSLPGWVQILGLVVAGILIISLAGSVILKRQVNARTRELHQLNKEMEQRIMDRTAELQAVYLEQRAIFDSATVGIVLMRDRNIVNCNRKLEEIFGYGAGELMGKSMRIWYPNDAAYAIGGRVFYAQLEKGEVHRREYQFMRKNGSVFWARVSGKTFDANHPNKGAVVIVEDITLEREAAETLRNALEKAKTADRIKSAFLATMSHELRTPLNSIIGFTGILLQGLAGPLNPEQKKQMSMVQNSSRHLLALINDVLDISKIEAGQLELSMKTFDVKPCVEKMVKMILPLAENKGLEIQVDIADDVGAVTTDQRRLEQVILNVLTNAVKFTEKGRVHISCRSEKNTCLFSVADTGIGIRQEDIPKLFQPFHQIDSGLSRKFEGTGLGLSICKKLLDLMGGDIHVESQWGRGSTFFIRLPKQKGEGP